MKLNKKQLKNIEVELNEEGGFVVWVKEKHFINGEKKNVKRWIVDGSCIKEDGEIRLGVKNMNAIEAEYRETDNTIFINSKQEVTRSTELFIKHTCGVEFEWIPYDDIDKVSFKNPLTVKCPRCDEIIIITEIEE